MLGLKLIHVSKSGHNYRMCQLINSPAMYAIGIDTNIAVIVVSFLGS